MSISRLPLSYCTNVHRGNSLAEVHRGLRDFAGPIARRFGNTLGAGLWLSDVVSQQLIDEPMEIDRLAETLAELDLQCYTLNAFPFGDFHGQRVKEQVYHPAWDQPARLHYTQRCAAILARLLGSGEEGSISTLPLGFKLSSFVDIDLAMQQLIALASELAKLAADSGKIIRLAIEPEPLCLLETTAETVAFFERLFAMASKCGAEPAARRHLGACFDVCHQAVEFEEVGQSIAALQRAGMRINKVHLSCAIRCERPGENVDARQVLRLYAEPRYLHQTLAKAEDGRVLRAVDLDGPMITEPPTDFATACEWRVHFHVPIDATNLGALATTSAELSQAMHAVAALPYPPHLEVETYTWEVLPGQTAPDIVEGISRELAAAERLKAAAITAAIDHQ